MDQRERTIREIADHLARALLAAAEYANQNRPADPPAPMVESIPVRARGRLLTSEEVADLLGVSVKTLYQWHSHRPRPKGPVPIKVGKYLRWRQADVDAWIAERERGEG